MALRNFVIDSAVSIGASANGAAVSVDKNVSGFCVAGVVSAGSSPVGVLKLQASIDTGSSPTNWADTGLSFSISADGTVIFNVAQDHNYKWVRTVYTRTSGSGTLNTTFNENQ